MTIKTLKIDVPAKLANLVSGETRFIFHVGEGLGESAIRSRIRRAVVKMSTPQSSVNIPDESELNIYTRYVLLGGDGRCLKSGVNEKQRRTYFAIIGGVKKEMKLSQISIFLNIPVETLRSRIKRAVSSKRISARGSVLVSSVGVKQL